MNQDCLCECRQVSAPPVFCKQGLAGEQSTSVSAALGEWLGYPEPLEQSEDVNAMVSGGLSRRVPIARSAGQKRTIEEESRGISLSGASLYEYGPADVSWSIAWLSSSEWERPAEIAERIIRKHYKSLTGVGFDYREDPEIEGMARLVATVSVRGSLEEVLADEDACEAELDKVLPPGFRDLLTVVQRWIS